MESAGKLEDERESSGKLEDEQESGGKIEDERESSMMHGGRELWEVLE